LLEIAKINTYEKTLYNRAMLPQEELDYLDSLQNPSERLRALHEAGWSLSTLASSIKPPRPKSTLYYQVKNAPSPDLSRPVPPPPAPLPQVRSISPSVNAKQAEELASLSALARNCRSKTPPSSPYRLANTELTELVTSLYLQGVPVNTIAKAAKVSPRAMFRRVSKGLGNV
jgi:hypothetical protein